MNETSVRFRYGEGRERCATGELYLSRIRKIKRNRRDVANVKISLIVRGNRHQPCG
jgi:hypothetical protein